ncbi:MAG TPA: dTMP kinase [Myxococcota bacterium]|nr:dTMP kinase [Myxococcota bacterium]
MGKMIVIEGMDGAGTTTQSQLLLDYLNKIGLKAIKSAEPTKSPFGQEIRKWLATPIEKEPYLLTMLALAFAADRMHHVHHTLAPALKSYDFLIVDRYVLSSLVYQGLHLPNAYITEINRFALIPDVTLVLDISAKEAINRLGERASDKDFYETKPTLEKIRARYLHFVDQDLEHLVLIDASGSIEQVHNQIVSVVKRRFHI